MPTALTPFMNYFLNPWALLGVCIALEVTGTTMLTRSEGFSKAGYGIGAILLFCICFWILSHVLTKIPVGVAYAIWSGAGIAAISVIGWLFLKQTLSPAQIGFILLIVIGAVGLNLVTGGKH